MKRGIVLAAAIALLGTAVLDIAPEGIRTIGTTLTLGLLLAGVAMWAGLRFKLRQTAYGLIAPLSMAIWLHSLLEGALAATVLHLNPSLGSLLIIGLGLHLLPELMAVIALVYHQGASLKQAILVGAITIGIAALSLSLFRLFPIAEMPAQIIASLVGGSLLFIGGSAIYQLARSHTEAYGQN